MKKKQVFIIHGGMTFKNKSDYLNYLKAREVSLEKKIYWTDAYLENALGKSFEVIRPRMPLSENARYEEWKIHFEKFVPFMQLSYHKITTRPRLVIWLYFTNESKGPLFRKTNKILLNPQRV